MPGNINNKSDQSYDEDADAGYLDNDAEFLLARFFGYFKYSDAFVHKTLQSSEHNKTRGKGAF